jgi:hypothetical protein
MTIFYITREGKEIKICGFRHSTRVIMEYGSMFKLDWSTSWPIGFDRTFMVGHVLSVKFSRKMFLNDDNILQGGLFNSKLM